MISAAAAALLVLLPARSLVNRYAAEGLLQGAGAVAAAGLAVMAVSLSVFLLTAGGETRSLLKRLVRRDR